jgi:hypothetical protein
MVKHLGDLADPLLPVDAVNLSKFADRPNSVDPFAGIAPSLGAPRRFGGGV